MSFETKKAEAQLLVTLPTQIQRRIKDFSEDLATERIWPQRGSGNREDLATEISLSCGSRDFVRGMKEEGARRPSSLWNPFDILIRKGSSKS